MPLAYLTSTSVLDLALKRPWAMAGIASGLEPGNHSFLLEMVAEVSRRAQRRASKVGGVNWSRGLRGFCSWADVSGHGRRIGRCCPLGTIVQSEWTMATDGYHGDAQILPWTWPSYDDRAGTQDQIVDLVIATI